MSITTFTDVFNDDELKNLENDTLVQLYKTEAINNNQKFIKFTVPIGNDMKNKLKQYKINIKTNELNMMWIKGDIENHVDKCEQPFKFTNVIYITDDENDGKLVIDGKQFPIKKGNGYRFSYGLEHETIGTHSDKMRLMIGPISEKGYSVGGISSKVYYLLQNPPDYSKPYFIPTDQSKFINNSEIPPEFIPENQQLKSWYIFNLTDPDHAIYKIGNKILPNTPYLADSPYFVYPIWESSIIELNTFEKLTKPAYTDNSLIFYKPHSLAPGGTAGVKNVRAKSRRT